MSLCLRLPRAALQISTLRGALTTTGSPLKHALLQQSSQNSGLFLLARDMSGKRTFVIHPSRFVWRRWKKDAHFFVMIAVIPLTLISLYFNLTVGPAELAEMPEGYIPREWEYYKNPVSRFLIRYVQDTPQKGYEQMLQCMTEEADKIRVRRLLMKINALQAERMDYLGYHMLKGPSSKWHMKHREDMEEVLLERRIGGQPGM